VNRVDLTGLYDREYLKDAGGSCFGGAAEGGGAAVLTGNVEAAPAAAAGGCAVGVAATSAEYLTRKNFGKTAGDVVKSINIAHDAYEGADDIVKSIF
jgi:hypothetical protein